MNPKIDGASLRVRHHPSLRLEPIAAKVLHSTKLMSLATVGLKGQPHISTAYFSFSRTLDLYYVSDVNSSHARFLEADPAAAATVFDTHQSWQSDHAGLQLFGTSWLARPAEVIVAARVHLRRFPEYRRYLAGSSSEQLATSPYKYFIFRPSRIKLLAEETLGEESLIEAVVRRSKTR